MSVFKRRRFPAEIILLCVRWYCRYGISRRSAATGIRPSTAPCPLPTGAPCRAQAIFATVPRLPRRRKCARARCAFPLPAIVLNLDYDFPFANIEEVLSW